MKRGFTLIELLAVIVILAVIALIATPIVLNLIEDAKISSNKTSSDNIEKAAILFVTGKKNEYEKYDSNLLNRIEYTGTSPEDYGYYGYGVYVNNEGRTAMALRYGKKCYKKDYLNEEITIEDYENSSCSIVSVEPWDGSSTEIIAVGNTYEVETAEQLAWVSEQVALGNTFNGKTIILKNDINFGIYFDSKGNILYNEQNFIPIGYGDYFFEGTFDGQNHIIYNLYVNFPEVTGVGLFGNVSGANIKNLILKNSYIEGLIKTGIIGSINGNNSIVDNVKSINNNIVSLSKQAAGIVGIISSTASNTQIKNCFNNSQISILGAAAYSEIGGIVARIGSNGIISNNINISTLGNKDIKHIGGIVGYISYIDDELIINNNINYGDITASEYAGGIVDFSLSATIDSNVNYGSVTSNDFCVGGIVSYSSSTTIDSNVNYGSVISSSYGVGGIVGYMKNSDVDSNKNFGDVTGEVKWIGGIVGATTSSAINYNVISNNINKGNISTTKGAIRVAGIVGNANAGALIYNCVNYGEINGLGNATVLSYGTGGIVGSIGNIEDLEEYTPTYIYNCYNTGSIKGKTGVGGIIGNLYEETLSYVNTINVYNLGSITSTTGYAGGIVGIYHIPGGIATDYVDKAYNLGEVKGTYAGGLIGSNVGISNSINLTAPNGTNNDGIIMNNTGVNTNNVYYLSDMESNYGTSIISSNLTKEFYQNLLGDYWNFNSEYPRLYKLNIVTGENKTITITTMNEILR